MYTEYKKKHISNKQRKFLEFTLKRKVGSFSTSLTKFDINCVEYILKHGAYRDGGILQKTLGSIRKRFHHAYDTYLIDLEI